MADDKQVESNPTRPQPAPKGEKPMPPPPPPPKNWTWIDSKATLTDSSAVRTSDDRIAQLEAENKRLREALKSIGETEVAVFIEGQAEPINR